MNQDAVDKLIKDLEKQGYKITPPPEPDPELNCSKCGVSESQATYEMLQDITVKTCEGEEGFSAVRNFYCVDCFGGVCDALVNLGFVSHRHGTTSSLEDFNCPGYSTYGECPTPSDEVEWEL